MHVRRMKNLFLEKPRLVLPYGCSSTREEEADGSLKLSGWAVESNELVLGKNKRLFLRKQADDTQRMTLGT